MEICSNSEMLSLYSEVKQAPVCKESKEERLSRTLQTIRDFFEERGEAVESVSLSHWCYTMRAQAGVFEVTGSNGTVQKVLASYDADGQISIKSF